MTYTPTVRKPTCVPRGKQCSQMHCGKKRLAKGLCAAHYRRHQLGLHKLTCGQCVRGILCPRCNQMLGRVNDDVSILRAMIAYLEGTP